MHKVCSGCQQHCQRVFERGQVPIQICFPRRLFAEPGSVDVIFQNVFRMLDQAGDGGRLRPGQDGSIGQMDFEVADAAAAKP